MKEMLLLGAGASVPAGIPASQGMVSEIVSRFAAQKRGNSRLRVIYYVLGGLLFGKGSQGLDPLSGVDVEELFNAVTLLGERDSLEAAPFIGSWHQMVGSLDKAAIPAYEASRFGRHVYSSVIAELNRALPSGPGTEGLGGEVDRAIKSDLEGLQKNPNKSVQLQKSVGAAVEKAIRSALHSWMRRINAHQPPGIGSFGGHFTEAVERVFRSGEGGIYRETAAEMIRVLTGIVWIDSEQRVRYLAPLLRPLSRQNRLVIATLNYDNSLELLATSLGVPWSTGLDVWGERGMIDIVGQGLHVLKLHGSIDWGIVSEKEAANRMPVLEIIRRSSEEVKEGNYTPAVIFGQRNKLKAEGPFLDLLRAFREALDQAESLTVIGYSFRDSHVNEYISQWLNRDTAHRIRIVDPGFEKNPAEYAVALKKYAASQTEVSLESAETALETVFPAHGNGISAVPKYDDITL